MSGYRPIYKRIWKDPDFQDLSPEDKLLFIYLCTNEATNESGIYPITPKTISDETNIPLETVKERLLNGCLKNIVYDINARVIFVKNLQRYNTGGRPELIALAIEKEKQAIPHETFWLEFVFLYPKFEGLCNGCTPVVQPTDNDTIRYSNDKDKVVYGEFKNVLLKDEEYAKLLEKYGENGVKERIEKLSAGIESKGYRYKSHYATILNWERMDEKRDGTHRGDIQQPKSQGYRVIK